MTRLSLLLLLLLLPSAALAQVQFRPHDGHDQFHAHYQNWINGKNDGCCNDQDCGPLAAADERETSTGIEVRIEGQWCPVQRWHYLTKGNAPDWSTAHVCIADKVNKTPCDRLLCYQPKPGT